MVWWLQVDAAVKAAMAAETRGAPVLFNGIDYGVKTDTALAEYFRAEVQEAYAASRRVAEGEEARAAALCPAAL
jgi:hypothetical protein